MRYLIKARLKKHREKSLLQALATGDLGRGSIAGDEYQHNMRHARLGRDGVVHWVETCFCSIPLEEERPYWEKYFDILSIRDAHSRRNCRHENRSEPWACSNCDCTARLESKLSQTAQPFLATLSKKPDLT